MHILHVLQMPMCEDDWLKISNDFTARCNFPHCIGALDGKHISILPPPNSGSLYYNYKRFFSLVLLALVDSYCRFIYVDIGAYGRTSDGGVYNNSSLAAAVENGELHLPPSSTIPGTDRDMPYVMVGDDAFALKPYLLKPYALRNLTEQQRIFNYRLSRARRTAENAFGQLSQRFRVFGRPIPLMPEKVETVVMAACCLHNFLLRDAASQAVYMPNEKTTATTMKSMPRQGSNRSSQVAQDVRNLYCQ